MFTPTLTPVKGGGDMLCGIILLKKIVIALGGGAFKQWEMKGIMI